jgi:hypothetical protein
MIFFSHDIAAWIGIPTAIVIVFLVVFGRKFKRWIRQRKNNKAKMPQAADAAGIQGTQPDLQEPDAAHPTRSAGATGLGSLRATGPRHRLSKRLSRR